MAPRYSIEDLTNAVNAWCDQHGIRPASGQAGEAVSERNIRYYRTFGLLDAPEQAVGAGFGEKHFLQLVAIRLLQAQGLPLRRIRELLFGRTVEQLREIQTRGLAEAQQKPQLPFATGEEEMWRATPLSADFMLISRHGTRLTGGQQQQILSILHPSKKRAAGRTASKSKEQK